MFREFIPITKYVIIRVCFLNVKHVKIRYDSLNISLSDIITRLQGMLSSVPVVLLSLPCTTLFHSHRTVLFAAAVYLI